jgi:integrase
MDVWLIDGWKTAMRAEGWTRSAAERGAKTLRGLSRVSAGGLLHATRDDIVRFAAAKGRGLPPDDLMASASWHRALCVLDAFYGWCKHRGLLQGSPLAGLRRRPRREPRSYATTLSAWRCYDRVLNDPKASARDRALLMCLAHGLTVAEVGRLCVDDVDLERQELKVVGTGSRRRLVSLSTRAVERLTPWARRRRAETGKCAPLFPTKRGGSISASTVDQVVLAATRRVFPRPQQAEIRRRVRATGFRECLVARLVRRRASADVLAALLGVEKLDLRRLRIAPPTPEGLVEELARVRRRWRAWI